MGNANDQVSLAGDDSDDDNENGRITGNGEHSDPANDYPLSSGSPSGNGRPTGGATNGRRGGSVYEPADGDLGETREGIGSFSAAGYNIPDENQW